MLLPRLGMNTCAKLARNTNVPVACGCGSSTGCRVRVVIVQRVTSHSGCISKSTWLTRLPVFSFRTGDTLMCLVRPGGRRCPHCSTMTIVGAVRRGLRSEPMADLHWGARFAAGPSVTPFGELVLHKAASHEYITSFLCTGSHFAGIAGGRA